MHNARNFGFFCFFPGISAKTLPSPEMSTQMAKKINRNSQLAQACNTSGCYGPIKKSILASFNPYTISEIRGFRNCSHRFRVATRDARWFIFKPKIKKLGQILEGLRLENVHIFYGHLEHLMDICDIL
jgi:hypothetical protein